MKINKNKLAVLAALLICCVFLLAACGAKEPSQDSVIKAYEDAGYTCIAGGADGMWSIVALREDLLENGIFDSVTIIRYADKSTADAMEKMARDTAKARRGAKNYARRGNAFAITVTSGTNPAESLKPFKNA